jgi:hypothetical protein
MGDAEDAVERLVRVVQPPDAVAGAPGDWLHFELDNGFELPSDYRAMLDRYGLGGFGWNASTGPWLLPIDAFDQSRSFVECSEEDRQFFLGQRRQYPGVVPSWPMWPEPGGLLPWATSIDGDVIGWSSTGSSPDAWRTYYYGHGGPYLELGMTAVGFLAALMAGTIPALSELAAEGTPTFWPSARGPRRDMAQSQTVDITMANNRERFDGAAASSTAIFDAWKARADEAGIVIRSVRWLEATSDAAHPTTLSITVAVDRVPDAKMLVAELASALGARIVDIRDPSYERVWTDLTS